MWHTILLALFFLVSSSFSADPTLATYSVNDLLAQPGWADISPPAVSTGNCVPAHRGCKRWMKPHEIELSTSTAGYNFGMFENNQLRYMVHLKNLLGVKRIHARTGPRSLQDLRLQNALWACPFVPELEIELQPRGENNELLKVVELELIVFLTECDLDILGGEDPRAHLSIGVKYGHTRHMVMSPMYNVQSQYNTDLYGELALYAHIKQLTPGVNQFMFVRGAQEGIIPAFNAEQASGEQSINNNLNWMWPVTLLLLTMSVLTLVFVMGSYFGRDKERQSMTLITQSLIASSTQQLQLMGAIEQQMAHTTTVLANIASRMGIAHRPKKAVFHNNNE